MGRFLTICFWLFSASVVNVMAAEHFQADEYFGRFFPAEQRAAYENSSGSCVYMSTAAVGMNQNLPEAWTLPWDCEYGSAARGGAYPSSIEKHAKRRGIAALVVTGDETYEYMRWGIANNRWVAIGLSSQHFQTLVGYDDKGTPDEKDDTWDVWNCNRYHHVTRYTDSEFRRLHELVKWCVVINGHPDRPGIPEQIAK